MNERIDQLWGQALDRAVPETYSQLSHSQVLKVKQVFAELIVQECVDKTFDSEKGIGTTRWKTEVMAELKEHFGVEK